MKWNSFKFPEDPMLNISKMTLDEVVEETKNLDINTQGGLRYMIEKMVMELHRLEDEINKIKRG